MQRYSVIEITNLEPLKIGAGGSKANQIEPSKDFIPGSTIRGALIGQWKRKDEQSFEANKSSILTQVDCYNAYPYCVEDLFIPVPLHLRMSKHEWRKAKMSDRRYSEELNPVVQLANLLQEGPGKDKNTLEYRFVAVKDGYMVGLNVNKEYRIHHNTIRREGEKERDNLFRYQAIETGQTFRTIIRYDSSLEQLVEPMLEQLSDVYIGGAKGSGYGLCRWKLIKGGIADYRDAMQSLGLRMVKKGANEQLIITCLSDCLCRNNAGQPINYISPEEIENLCGVPVKLINQFIQSGMTEGYNTTWKTRYPKEATVKAGSVLVYQLLRKLTDEEKARMIQALESRLIGNRTQDGYGWIGVDFSYPDRLSVQPIKSVGFHNQSEETSSQVIISAVTEDEARVQSILVSGLEQARLRWVNMICYKSLQKENGSEIVISEQLKGNQLNQMKHQVLSVLEAIKADRQPVLPPPLNRDYVKDGSLCLIAGYHFNEIMEFLCSDNSSSFTTLWEYARRKLASKKGELLYYNTSFPEKQFIAELLYAGLHIRDRRYSR